MLTTEFYKIEYVGGELMSQARVEQLKYVFRRVNTDGEAAVSRAERICDGNIYLISTLKENNVTNVDCIWSLEGNPLNTYKVYLYSLQFMGYINNAFNINKSAKYLRKCGEILNSFYNFIENGNIEFVYYDFAIANRVIIITEYIDLCNRYKYEIDKNIFEKIIKILKKDINILFDDNHYRWDNHGLMMDRALLQYASLFKYELDSKSILEKSIERIRKQFEVSFGEEYLNIENSSEYHYLNYALFKDINDFIKQNNLELETFNLEEVYNNHCLLLKNDRTYPLIGDTSKIKYRDPVINESKIFNKSGVALIKDDLIYFLCKSGFISTAHKHYDDNSFFLNYDNKDIFIDSGKYSYNNNDEMRKYIKSPIAHNTISVNEELYTLEIKDGLSGITSAFIDNEVAIINMFNNRYKNCTFTRRFIVIKPNIIIVINDISSNSENRYLQMFNMNENFKVIDNGDNNIVLADNNHLVSICEHKQQSKINKYYGLNKDGLIRGFASDKFNEIHPINTLEFEYNAKNLESVIGILVKTGLNNEADSYELYNIDDEKIMLSVRDSNLFKIYYKINYINGQVTKYRIPIIKISLEKDRCGISINECSNKEYAVYYLIDNTIIQKTQYSSNTNFEYNFNKNGRKEVWVFIKFDDGERIIEKFKLD